MLYLTLGTWKGHSWYIAARRLKNKECYEKDVFHERGVKKEKDHTHYTVTVDFPSNEIASSKFRSLKSSLPFPIIFFLVLLLFSSSCNEFQTNNSASKEQKSLSLELFLD